MLRLASSVSGKPARRVLVLLNPGAGHRQAMREAQRRIQEHQSLDLELITPDPSDHRGQLAHAAEAVETGVDAVVVCGGDGMVSAGFNLVAQRGMPLGIIPVGTGNDFARAAGIARRYEQAWQNVLQALEQPQLPVRAVDALRIVVKPGQDEAARPRWAANAVNIGFDARVNQRANAARRTPRQLRYLVALAREVPGFRHVRFQAHVDDDAAADWDSALICIQNGSTIGGGIPLARSARIDDGWADVSHVAPLSRAGLVALFPLLMMRQHRWLKPLTTFRRAS